MTIISTSLKKNKKKQQTSKKFDTKELPEKPTKDDVSSFNEWVNEKERGRSSKVFQKHFSFQRPSDMLKSTNLQRTLLCLKPKRP